jgi:hypothetical protein
MKKVGLKFIPSSPIDCNQTPFKIINPVTDVEFNVIISTQTVQNFHGVCTYSKKNATRPTSWWLRSPFKLYPT